ncbi:hypothetical protein [Streptomyces spiralis]|uniref:hypothetical protein n=1 Tax=Streptomyces spiralis TaxID=66376 RepID=UPI0036CFD3C7
MISRRGLLVAGTAVAAASVSAAPAAAVPAAPADAAAGLGSAGGRARPVSVVAVDPADTAQEIIAKAAAIVPGPPQVAWQTREITVFTHFGMNTFTGREWGSGCEDEATFAPSEVGIDQWMQAYRAAGMKQVMLTA